MFSRLRRWMNDRWPLDAVIRWSLEEEMPGGTSYAYVFSSCVFTQDGYNVFSQVSRPIAALSLDCRSDP